MEVACVGLVHCDSCECKVKDFYALSSYGRKVERSLAMVATHTEVKRQIHERSFDLFDKDKNLSFFHMIHS